jgi:hypothetical protein
MNRTMKIIAAAAAFTMLGMGSAWADCGLKPNVPEIPATPDGKQMEKVANEYDAYQTKFIEFSNCINKEFEESQTAFKAALDSYQASAAASKSAPKKK